MKAILLSSLLCLSTAFLANTTAAQTPKNAVTDEAEVRKAVDEIKAEGIEVIGNDLMKLNTLGYQAMYDKKDPKSALKFFKWNLVLFPNNPDLLDSLAEGYLQAGDISHTIEFYEKALAVNPKLRTNGTAYIARLKADSNSLPSVQAEARDEYRKAIANGPPQE